MAYKAPYKSKYKPAWRLYWTAYDGKRKTKVFFGSEKEADKVLFRFQHEEGLIKYGLKPVNSKIKSFEDAKMEYFEYLKSDNKAKSTIDRYGCSLRAFQDFQGANKLVNTIEKQDIVRFKIKRAKICTYTGVNIDLRHLKAFFNWCVYMGYASKNPLFGLKIIEKISDVRFLSGDEVNNLFSVITKHKDKIASDLIMFYINTGARANEILPPLFKWDNIFDSEIKIIGKGARIRYIPINETMRSMLDSRRNLPFPFPYTYGVVYSKIVRKYYRLANIKNADIHTLRKTTGALMIKAGIDVYRVSKFLGHCSVTVTERYYVNLLKEDYAKLSNALDKWSDSIYH